MILSTNDCWFVLCQVVTDDGLRYLPLGAKDLKDRRAIVTPEVTIPFVYACHSQATSAVRLLKSAGAPIILWEILHCTEDLLGQLLATIHISTTTCVLHPGENVIQVVLEANQRKPLTGQKQKPAPQVEVALTL